MQGLVVFLLFISLSVPVYLSLVILRLVGIKLKTWIHGSFVNDSWTIHGLGLTMTTYSIHDRYVSVQSTSGTGSEVGSPR